MFVCECPTCGRRELRGPGSLFSMTVPGVEGPVLAAACNGCGTHVPVVTPKAA